MGHDNDVSSSLKERSFVLRRFRREDLEKVEYINNVCLPEHYSSYFYIDLLKRFPEAFLVAEMNGEIIGYIMCRIETGLSNIKRFSLARKGHVVSIAVLKEHRNKGVGESLVVQAIQNMMNYEVEECYLEVRVSNYPAIKLYRKLGFDIAKRIKGYYVDGEDAYLMVKKVQ